MMWHKCIIRKEKIKSFINMDGRTEAIRLLPQPADRALAQNDNQI